MHSIRFKIAAITIAAILASVLLVFAVSHATVRAENDRKSVETMDLIAQDTKQSLENYLENIEQSVEMVANLAGDALDSVVLAENGAAGAHVSQAERTAAQAARLDAYLADYCEGVQNDFESIASRTPGVVTYYYCINPEISQTEHGFFYSKVGRGGFAAQTPLDARTLDPADTAHTVWYYAPIERGRPSWVGPYTAHFLGEMWICSYLVPIYRSGALIGVLGMDIPVDTLVEQVSSIRLYQSGFACLFDGEGRAVYHPSLEIGDTPETLGLSVGTATFQPDSSGGAMIRYTADGQVRQISFCTLSNSMKLLVAAPLREINASWVRLTRTVLLTTAGIIVLAVAALLLLLRFLTRPLLRLTAASRRLAAADYDVELDYDSRDEVGELTDAFRQMRDQQKAYIEDLNRRVDTDPLTGLPNMHWFHEHAEAGRTRIHESGKASAMLYFDLIGMKHFNRQYRLEEGDQLLCAVGQILVAHLGAGRVCRISDDHFAALADETQLADDLQGLFTELEHANEGRALPVRAGVYLDSVEPVGPGLACDRAKFASDQHKDVYTSGCYYFDREMLLRFENANYVNTNLDRALAEGWVQVHYQPIIRSASGRVCNDEALARWVDPERGMLSPAAFIPYLEESGLIWKLDLYVLEQVLKKLRIVTERGYPIVPHSINLSRADFSACDIVEEIRSRVDAAGVSRGLIAVEVTESIIGSDFDRIKAQVERFRTLGFQVWLDDFGAGYSSLDVLQSIQFDLIKLDMSFTRRIDDGSGSRIVLTELIKLITSLGLESICEGVETERQMRFLQEIGCSKLQGYYFGRPLPLDEVLIRYANPQRGYENAVEAPYYEALSKVNLYDLSVLGVGEEDAGERDLQNFFNTLPMGIIEVCGNKSRFVRSNRSYRDFVKRFLGFDLAREGTDFIPYDDAFVVNIVNTCCKLGVPSLFDQKMPNGSVVHSMARRIGVNPADGTTAVAVAVLSISDENEGATYAGIARALAADYYNIYYIDLDTEQFIEYTSPVGGEELAVERHGEQFFASVKRDAATRVFAEDRDAFLRTFTKENVVRELDAQGVFTTTYRLIDTGAPMYVSMKITRMLPFRNRLIMGVSIVDSQMKQQAEDEKNRMERIALGRVAALSGDSIVIYSVDPATDRYAEFSAAEVYEESFGLAKTGEDFFRQIEINSPKVVVAEDLPDYMRTVTKENMLRQIAQNGIFTYGYRLIINGTPTPVSLRAALVKEPDGEKLIVGIHLTSALPDVTAPGPADFQELADRLAKPCAILSVEKDADGVAGTIRILCANREYKEVMGGGYYDGMPYDELVPKVLQFEYSCYRCAFLQQQVHTYIQTKGSQLWTDQQLIPLHSDREDVGYCQFVIEISETRDRERMADVTMHTAFAVLRGAITLLGTNDLRERVRTVLTDIMTISEAFSVRLLLIDHENRRANNYCDVMSIELPADYVPPEEDPDKSVIPYPLICSWEKTLGENNSLIVTTERDMAAVEASNPVWIRTMRAYGVVNFMLIPLRREQEIIGYLYVCNFDTEKVQEIRELVELMSFFLGTEIYNEVLLHRLDEMSRTDALTGLNNRNAMLRCTDALAQAAAPVCFGVVNIDLNGLKTVNDFQGHDAGDRLLVLAAETLKRFFDPADLYRSGGDEFIVISSGMARGTFDEKVAQLRAATGDDGAVSFAIGAFWSDGTVDMTTALRQADEMMYANKEAYYAAHPEQRR